MRSTATISQACLVGNGFSLANPMAVKTKKKAFAA
jgi:hypothetical protein